MTRDAAFGWHNWTWARLQSKTGKSKAYYYYFDQHPDYPEGSPDFGHGSPHAQDVAYVFQHIDSTNTQTSKSDLEISAAMGAYWINFTKYGDPNGEEVPAWPAFTDKNRVVMYFAQTPHTGQVPGEQSLEVLDKYFKWRFTLEEARIENAK